MTSRTIKGACIKGRTQFTQAYHYVKRVLPCPICRNDLGITHSLENAIERNAVHTEIEVCNHCGSIWEFRHVVDQGLEVAQLTTDDQPNLWVPVFVLLRSSNADGRDPIYLVVDCHDHTNAIAEFQAEGTGSVECWYNENTCPTNWLRNARLCIHDGKTVLMPWATGIEMAYWDGSYDPHGVFTVKAIVTHEQAAKYLASRLPGGDILGLEANWKDDSDKLYALFAPFIEQEREPIDGQPVNRLS